MDGRSFLFLSLCILSLVFVRSRPILPRKPQQAENDAHQKPRNNESITNNGASYLQAKVIEQLPNIDDSIEKSIIEEQMSEDTETMKGGILISEEIPREEAEDEWITYLITEEKYTGDHEIIFF